MPGPPSPSLLLILALAVVGVAVGGTLRHRARRGGREVPALGIVHEDVTAPDRVTIGDGARVRGDVTAPVVVLGNRVAVEGTLRAARLVSGRGLKVAGRLEVTGRATFAGGVTVADVEPETGPLLVEGLALDVPTVHADAVLRAFRAVGWTAEDTGNTVATDDEEEGLTTLRVDVRLPPGEPLPAAPAAQAAAEERAPPAPLMALDPYVRRALLARGDLVVGEGVEMDVDTAATGDVLVGRHAYLAGRVSAGGDLYLGEGAVVGDAACGGELHVAEGARVAGSVEAAKGLAPGSRLEPRRGPQDNRGDVRA